MLKLPNAALRVRIAGVEPAAAASAAGAASAAPVSVAAVAGRDGGANGAAAGPPRERHAEAGGRPTTRGRIYLLGDDGKPVAYGVRLGISDGISTELIVAPGAPAADVLKEGARVIVGVNAPEDSKRPRSPF